jgi:hypothetical protein
MKKKISKIAQAFSERCDIYLKYTESRSGGEPIDPDDRWTSHEDEYIDRELIGLFTESFDSPGAITSTGITYSEKFTVPKSYASAESLYVVGIRYSDGDTFGQTHGYIHWIGLAKTEKEAQKLLETAKSDKKGYKPWEGYFSDFEADEIHCLLVTS